MEVYALHGPRDAADNNKYFPATKFRGFGGNRFGFVAGALRAGKRADTVVLSHVNLLSVGWMIKRVNPAVKLMMFAHGIEIWPPAGRRRRMFLRAVDKFISVSSYTDARIAERHAIASARRTVLNNCIDPFLPSAVTPDARAGIRARYGLTESDFVLYSLTRVSKRDRYKGYDRVICNLAMLQTANPEIRLIYMITGSCTADERTYIQKQLQRHSLTDNVILTGFIPDEELADHFAAADIYVMPSRKEGFGIVFVEAMHAGLPVIAGNMDGSVDALLNGKLGILINPDDDAALRDAVQKMINDRDQYLPNWKLLREHFSYETYKRSLDAILDGC